MWLAHHEPEQYDRCVVIGGHHVCRRCLVLYPLGFAVLALLLAAPESWLDTSGWSIGLWLLPLPAVTDWLGEVTGRWGYSAARQTVCTVIAAPALGAGLARWVRSPGDATVLVPFALIAVICSVVWVVSTLRSELGEQAGWDERFERSERERRERLAAMVGVDPDVAVPGQLDTGQLGTVTKSISSSTAPTSDGSRSL